jgi:NADH:ubiquinone oxidoreductase subunit F (NADH-binding)/(2Fe-2S) ferredoxin/Pyruvate/2-oxoacid:ferredoxin oxidoreductase delta subunit
MALNQFCLVCGGTGCESRHSDAVYKNLKSAAEELGVGNQVQVVKTGCFGFCEKGPIVKILPDESFYVGVKPEDAHQIMAEHLVKGLPVEHLLHKTHGHHSGWGEYASQLYQKQVRIVLRNCGIIDPEDVQEYISRDGYAGLEKALFEMSPTEVIAEVKASGLRGRGGAGFPTGLKWENTRKTVSDQRYVICNADEGDPGAYMDRSTLEGDPHSVLEAMTIAGYAMGASQGFIYIRAEYPLAIHRLEVAMQQSREMGLLGKDILGSGFDFAIEIRLGAGAFVCGEETALMQSIEGNRGMPQPKPPYPSESGLWGKPTAINNVETLANIPVILLKGSAWFASIGTPTSKGTKVFALTGKINNSGLVEVPMGTTLREIVYDIGGGIRGGKAFKAVQSGGPSGGVLPAQFLDTPIDYESLTKVGSMMGSGGLIVLDEDDCIVDVVKFYLDFSVEESCGKCAPCRIGGRKLLNLLTKITKGKGTRADIETMRQIGFAMQRASLCMLGGTTPNPILSTLKYFENEYLEHIDHQHCPAGKCKDLITYSVLASKCIGCTVCARKCPVNCISGERKSAHFIDPAKCIKCGACYEACKFEAILVS